MILHRNINELIKTSCGLLRYSLLQMFVFICVESVVGSLEGGFSSLQLKISQL